MDCRTIIDKEMIAGSSKRAFSTLKTLARTSQPKATVISDADGNLFTETAAVH
ncbi:hypothetical protein DPMN_096633 [Dreissena polymorpha]|uniref:Uncharacterized protein n=1 Tax=Dreissena polymorpha TaxID=45954 RepID=A0A9D4LA44_DREPO|nr:hypothetical protein DPMN_096633 [Dreissena polymorpha]